MHLQRMMTGKLANLIMDRPSSEITNFALLAIAAVVALTGCPSSYRYCIRLPMPQDRAGIEAEQCARECRHNHNEADYDYLRCLSACPGAVVTQNDKCRPADERPDLMCRVTDSDITQSRAAVASDDTGSGVLSAIGAIAIGAIAAAAESGNNKNESSSTTDEFGGKPRAAHAAVAAQPEPAKHKPAEPSTSPKPANPSREP